MLKHARSSAAACELLAVAREIYFPEKGWNVGPCIGSAESQPLGHQGSPYFLSFDVSYFTGTKWYFTVILIYISLMISDIEHLFIYLLTICMSSLEKKKCFFLYSEHFEIRLVGCFYYSVV